jgi:DNA-binding LacI/PurR family transcriptional regulator
MSEKPVRARHATISDVARTAGVSRQTVSNVINAPQTVRAETRARVEAAIDQLRYRPNASARRLRTRRSATIAIRAEEQAGGVSGTIYDRFLHALAMEAGLRGRRILLFAAEDASHEIQQYRSLSYGDDVDALILTGTSHTDARIGWLVDHRVPFVSFGRPWSRPRLDDPLVPWVDVDGAAGVRLATEHLQDRGCRRIAFVGWPSPSGTGDDRRSGWEQAMRRRGWTEDGLGTLRADAPEDIGAAARAVSRLIDGLGPDAPDAFVCASDTLALGTLLGGGRGHPVIGFDDTPVAASQGFSSVAQPLDRVARAVLDLVDSLTAPEEGAGAGDPAARHVLLAPRLVVRDEAAPAASRLWS